MFGPLQALVAGVLASSVLVVNSAPSCMDESGNPVDWFVVLKQSDSANYLYADANDETLSTSSYTLQDSSGAVTNTLNNAFAESFVMYNDQPPNKSPYDYDGHSKGVVAVADDASQGFWFIHSVPRWPSRSGSSYQGFPDDETDYGQSMLCISMHGKYLETVASAWLLNRPEFYDASLSSTVQDNLPEFAEVALKHTHYSPAATNTSHISSLNGVDFTVFSKNTAWGMDLYNALLSPYFSANTLAETWENGVGQLQWFCTPQYDWTTKNIETWTVDGYTMQETKDHSKWAIIEDQGIICIGDINRMSTQFKRGGGTICFSSSTITSTLQASMTFWQTPPRGGCAPAP